VQISFGRILRPYRLTALVHGTRTMQSRMVKKPKLRASHADSAWEDSIARNLYGSDIAEDSMQADARSKHH
jgi:hypothetical protein